MHRFLGPFSTFIAENRTVAYTLLFIGVFFEGELTLILAGIFVHLGILSFPIVAVVTVVAAIAKTHVGYRIGQYVGRKFPESHMLKYIERRVLFIMPHFKERPFWSIVVSKCIYGFNNLALIFAGYTAANRKKYFMAEFLSSAAWLSGMFGLGYFFSRTALAISHNVRTFGLIVLLFIIGFMILQKLINLVIEVIEEWDA